MIINGTNNHRMMSKDKDKNTPIQDIDLFSQKKSIIPAEMRVYLPNWENKPRHTRNIITANNGEIILAKSGGHFCVCAKAGVGKSSIIEAIISSHISKEADSFSINISLYDFRNKILVLDTERSQGETWEAWERLARRSRVNQPNEMQSIIFANIKALALMDKRKFVEDVLSKNDDIGMVVFDGSSDFVADVNNGVEANNFIDWLNTFHPYISTIHTIHTNPSDDKPRGHLGSELLRRANGVLLAKKLGDGVVQLTSNFDNGKVRWGGDFTTHFSYDLNAEMMLSVDFITPTKKEQENEEKYVQYAKEIYGDYKHLFFADIVKGIMDKVGKNKPSCEQIFNRHFKNKILIKDGINGWSIK